MHLVLGAAASSHVEIMVFYYEIIYGKNTQKAGNNYRKYKRDENLVVIMFNVYEKPDFSTLTPS